MTFDKVTKIASAALAAGGVGAAVLFGLAGPAAADYGPTAQHQVEISAAITPNLGGPGSGGGIWLWIELDGSSPTSGGTGTFHGADCLHNLLGMTSSTSVSGTVTWTDSSGTIMITGYKLGNMIPVGIDVPLSGHETVSLSTVFPDSLVAGFSGTANVVVAP